MTTVNPFQGRSDRALRQAGWFPGRQVDLAPFLLSIERLHAVASEAIRLFLREFGGLAIKYTRPAVGPLPEYVDEVRLDPEFGESWRVLDYEVIIGKPVCPIGDVYRHHMTLMMSADGHVYGAYDDCVVLFGTSPAKALNTIIENREATHLT